MTVPIQPVPDPRIVANLQRLKDAGAGDDVLNAYLQEEAAKPARPTVNMAKVRARQNANEQDMADAQTPSYMESALGGIAALLKHVPGGEAAQAGARSVVRGQPYSQALSDIRGSEDDNPASALTGLAGGAVAASAMPGSPVVSGGLYGATNGMLAPTGNLKDRATSAAIQGTTGAIAGKLLPALFSYVGSKFTPTLGAQAVTRDAAMRVADDAAYGAAQREGTDAIMTPAVRKAFANPITAEYVSLVRNAPQYANADEATILRETYKLMSRDQGGHATFMENNGFDAARQLKMDAIGSAKKQLLSAAEATGELTFPAVQRRITAPAASTAQSPAPDTRTAIGNFWDRINAVHARADGTVEQQLARQALERHSAENVVSPSLTGAPPGPRSTVVDLSPERTVPLPGMMPSLPGAVAQHASLMGENEAGQQGQDVANRILSAARIGGKKQNFKSPEAFARDIKEMTPGEAQAALDGIMGRMKEFRSGSFKPWTGFGLPGNVVKAAKLQPYIQMLHAKTGGGLLGQAGTNIGQSGIAGLFGP